MPHKHLTMEDKKRIALVAHDNMKAVAWNIPIACNRASADLIISSPLMAGAYERLIADYEPYRQRLQGRSLNRDDGASA
jgi:methylglyoxal synthase